MQTIKRMGLKTKVQAWIETEKLPEYSCALFQKEGEDIAFEISADKSTCGKWIWYLNVLIKTKGMSYF